MDRDTYRKMRQEYLRNLSPKTPSQQFQHLIKCAISETRALYKFGLTKEEIVAGARQLVKDMQELPVKTVRSQND
jgi:hypothetical protein